MQTGSVRRSHPFRCRACRKGFSVKTDSVMHGSQLSYSKWAMAIYLMTRSKGVSSVQLAKDIEVTQKTAWFLSHRIREAMKSGDLNLKGPVEVDETFVGGKDGRRHAKDKLRQGASRAKTIVVGVKDRETGMVNVDVVKSRTDVELVSFVHANIANAFETVVYTDGLEAYNKLWTEHHYAVNHSGGQYVAGDAHTNGIESLWSMFKRGIMGTYHYISPKHTLRYAVEFAGRHNLRLLNGWDRLRKVVSGMNGKRLTWRQLVGRRGHKHPWQVKRSAYGVFMRPWNDQQPYAGPWSGVGKAMYEWLMLQVGMSSEDNLSFEV